MNATVGKLGGYFAERMKEPSSWAGVVAFAVTAIGATVDPGVTQALCYLGAAVAGGVAAAVK